MKFCTHCGEQIDEKAVICPKCGCATDTAVKSDETSSTLRTVAKIFMIIGCVTSAFVFLIPLCWTIPMTLNYFRALKENRPLSTAFKVCSLIFVSTVSGIIMLCDNEDNN